MCSVSAAPSVSSTRRRSGCPSALSCSGLSSVRTSRIGLDSVAAMPLYTPLSGCCLGRQSRGCCGIRDHTRAPLADRIRLEGVSGPGGRPNARSTASAFSSPVTMKTHLGRGAEHRHRQRDALDERLERWLRGNRPALALVERRLEREERRRVAVRADPEQDVVEAHSAHELVVLARRRPRTELAADPLHLPWRRPRSGRAGSRARAGSSSARRRAARSARRPTRARRRSSRARARPPARRRGPGCRRR